MSIGFIDIQSGYWAYDDIMEACNTFLEDGTPLFEGLPYQVFETGKGYIYEEIKAGKGQVVFTLSKSITPSESNPLFVFIDGVAYGYKSTKIVSGKTVVYLYTPPKQGSIVSFMSPGVPKLDKGRPITKTASYYPHYALKNRANYVYYGANGYYEYVNIFGRTLKRIALTPDELEGNSGSQNPEYDQNLARKYIGDRTDVYLVAPSGYIHLPWNFEGMTGKITYTYMSGESRKQTTEEFVPWTGKGDTTHEPYHNDRFFPNVWVRRHEIIEFLDRLRRYYYERLTDFDAPGPVLDQTITAYQGQTVFRLNGHYPAGKGLLSVRIGNQSLSKSEYTEFDDHTVLMKKPIEKGTVVDFYYEKTLSPTMYDIGRNIRCYNKTDDRLSWVNGTTEPWVKSALALDNEYLNDGTKLVFGRLIYTFFDPTNRTIPVTDDYLRPIGYVGQTRQFFMPLTPASRSEAIVFINRFRKWCLERFL